MTVRLIEGEKPYTAGDGIDISTDKVISVLLREENNLIHLNSNNEIYTDLQIVAGIEPTDDFEVGVTTGRVLESDGRPHTGTLLHYETTSGDYCQWLYGTDTNLYFDGGDGNRRQVYYSDQANEIFMRWMDFYFSTATGNNITLDLSTDYTPTSDFTINAPSTIKDGQVYILRVNNGSTVYNMTLGNNIDNMQGTDISLTPSATDMFVFLAVGGVLELQREVYTGDKIFYIKGDYSDGDDVGEEMEKRLNGTGQPSVFKDALIVETDGENLVYHRLDSYWEENGDYMISFATRTRIENNSADGTSRTKMRVIRFYFTYSSGTWTYSRFVDDTIYTTEKYIRADYDYATPYTPVYDGSPITLKYMEDNAVEFKDFETASVTGATLTISYFTTQITPSANFTLVAGTVKEGMQYIVRVNTGATAYTMSLGTGVTNPFGEDLTLTASKTTTVVLLATSSSTLEIFSIRTAE